MPPSLARKVDRIFSRWDKPTSPGCALAVVRDGRYLYKRCYGMADLEHGIPITPTTVFDVGSITKQFTATCIAILSQHGKLSLDDEITKYLPEMPCYDPPVTIRHLLNHTGGLRNMYLIMALMGRGGGVPPHDWGDITVPFVQEFRVLCRQKAGDFRAGDRWEYSNMGFHLLAEIVKRVSGTSLRRFADAAIYRPLGMRHTHLNDEWDEMVPNRARAYRPRKGGGFRTWEQPVGDPGAGGMFSTLEDMLRWDRNFRRNRSGKSGLMELMQTPAVLNDGTVQSYGMGLIQAVRRGARWIGHNGWYTGYVSCLAHYPEHGFSVVCLKNVADDGADGDPIVLMEKVTDLCLADVLTDGQGKKAPKRVKYPPVITLQPEKLARFAGDYRAADGGMCRIFHAGTMLLFGGNWEGRAELNPVRENEFVISGKAPDERIEFVEKQVGGPLRLIWHAGGKVIWELDRRDAPPDTGSGINTGDYAGYYHNDELETTLKVDAREKSLMIRGLGQVKEPWEAFHIEGEVFQGGRTQCTFSRDGDGHVAGFELQFNLTRLYWIRTSKPG